jgi:ADP-heptose:LPS heptosyltransferase
MNWEPEAERLARCIAELGDAKVEDAASWDLHLSEAERSEAARQIGAAALATHPIAVSVGTKVQAKDWGIDNWRELLGRMVVALPGRALLLIGAAEESAASEFAATAWRAGGGVVVNLCGRLNPRESAAALERVEMFLGHDSGPMHLAAAVGTPCVAVFAARNIPRQWFPLGKRETAAQHTVIYHQVECGGCGLETCVEQRKRCLMSVTVDEVMKAVKQRIGSGE